MGTFGTKPSRPPARAIWLWLLVLVLALLFVLPGGRKGLIALFGSAVGQLD
jgi:hypothetical protein